MLNLETNDQGTFTTWIVPEPDDILTVGWGQALARSLGRLLRVGVGTVLGNSSGIGTFAQQVTYQKPPIVKVWRLVPQVGGQTWYTDSDILGAGCSDNQDFFSIQSLTMLAPDPTTGSARYKLTLNSSPDGVAPAYRTDKYLVLANGR